MFSPVWILPRRWTSNVRSVISTTRAGAHRLDGRDHLAAVLDARALDGDLAQRVIAPGLDGVDRHDRPARAGDRRGDAAEHAGGLLGQLDAQRERELCRGRGHGCPSDDTGAVFRVWRAHDRSRPRPRSPRRPADRLPSRRGVSPWRPEPRARTASAIGSSRSSETAATTPSTTTSRSPMPRAPRSSKSRARRRSWPRSTQSLSRFDLDFAGDSVESVRGRRARMRASRARRRGAR